MVFSSAFWQFSLGLAHENTCSNCLKRYCLGTGLTQSDWGQDGRLNRNYWLAISFHDISFAISLPLILSLGGMGEGRGPRELAKLDSPGKWPLIQRLSWWDGGCWNRNSLLFVVCSVRMPTISSCGRNLLGITLNFGRTPSPSWSTFPSCMSCTFVRLAHARTRTPSHDTWIQTENIFRSGSCLETNASIRLSRRPISSEF